MHLGSIIFIVPIKIEICIKVRSPVITNVEFRLLITRVKALTARLPYAVRVAYAETRHVI